MDNKAVSKLDDTIEDWRLWMKKLGMDDSKIDDLDEQSLEIISKQTDKIKSMLKKQGYNYTYLKGLRRR